MAFRLKNSQSAAMMMALSYVLVVTILLLVAPSTVTVSAQESNATMMSSNMTTTEEYSLMVNGNESSVAMVDLNETVGPTMYPSESPSMAPSMAPTWLGNISPECANETAKLEQYENLTSSLSTLLDSYRDEFKKACPFTITDSGCSVKFEGPTSYQTLCESLGGQVFEHSVILQCGVKPLNTDYDLGVVPECIGISCNVSTVDMDLLGSDNISNFGNSLDNGGCQAKIESGAITSYYYVGGMLAANVAVALMTMSW